MAETIEMTVNGRRERVTVEPDTPLLTVLRNDLKVLGPKFGCGLGQCGACTVHLDGTAIRSCATPVSAAKGARVTTLEGLAPKPGTLHVVQQAFIDEQAAQCGYCINGWIMTAAELLERNPHASDAEIRQGLSGLKCRCGTHMAILRAVKLAAARLQPGDAPRGRTPEPMGGM
ncbi:MAG TPA: (2Fe-2S)-binding protein [Usitatibacter sp.]|nr:(2Fe-2S)-binding protein [Usitatibacter sp.]